MKLLNVILLAGTIAEGSTFETIREARIGLQVRRTYRKCRAGFLDWSEPECMQVKRIMATLFS